MRNYPDRRRQWIDPNNEMFSKSTKDIVRKIQHNKSVITEERITQFHHRRGRGRNSNGVSNCVGVGIVAHALIHYWQWEVSGVDEEWEAFEGQRGRFNETDMKLFLKIKDNDKLSKPWKEGYVDQVEISIRGKPNVYYI